VSGGILTFGSLFPGSLFTNGAIAYWLHSLQCVIGHGQHTTFITSNRNLLVVPDATEVWRNSCGQI